MARCRLSGRQRVDKAVEVLEKQLTQYPEEVDATHINILAELYMDRGSWAEAAALIQRSATILGIESGLPIDLQVCCSPLAGAQLHGHVIFPGRLCPSHGSRSQTIGVILQMWSTPWPLAIAPLLLNHKSCRCCDGDALCATTFF